MVFKRFPLYPFALPKDFTLMVNDGSTARILSILEVPSEIILGGAISRTKNLKVS